MIRIICGDPNGIRNTKTKNDNDSFGMVGIELDLDREQVDIRYAKVWTGKSYGEVIADFKKDYMRIKPKFFGLETNNTGHVAIREFRAAGMNAHGINTVSSLTELNRHKWQAMDKAFTVQYLKKKKRAQELLWPPKSSKAMKILENQCLSISEYVTLSGKAGYKARQGQHDDLFSALLLCVHMARIYIERDKN